MRGGRILVRLAADYPETLEYRIKVASHAILSNASATGRQSLPQYDFLAAKEQKIDHIDSLTGVSPELMFILQASNDLHFGNPEGKSNLAMDLLRRLESLKQVVTIQDIDEALTQKGDARFCVTMTAETYRLAAILYIRCRVLRFVNPVIHGRC